MNRSALEASELLSSMERLGVELWLDGESLGVRAPKGVLTADLRLALTEQKSQLLALLRSQNRTAPARTVAAAVSPPPLVPQPRTGALPLSFAQQRLWFLDQIEPGSATYNLPTALRMRGPLDVEALRQAVEAIVARHESLRTTFATEDGQPVQKIHPPGAWPFVSLDLSALAAGEREAQLLVEVRKEAVRPFDLDAGPLLRTTLVRLADEDHVLLATIHHVVSDGWSLGVLVRETAALYAAYAEGKSLRLPELPAQYADFAIWQRGWLAGEVLDTQLAYWRERLQGVPTLDLPVDHARPATPSHRGALEPFTLPAALTAKLRRLARERGVTLYMTLLAAFEVLLHRYTGQEDFAVGTPIANRTEREIEELIGFFVNTLVMRADLSANPSFVELLARVRREALGAYAHQAVPFERLVDEVGVERDGSRNPLFQVMFVMQNAPVEQMTLAGLTLESLAVDTGTAKFDLTLLMGEGPGGLVGSFEYATDLFDAPTMARLASHFVKLLGEIVEQPELRVGELPLLAPAERHQLVDEWNAISDYAHEACIHERFAAQVAKAPDAIAVEYEDERLTYRQLDARANQLAHHLQSLGVGPEVRVGICVERSLEMVVGLLGILKAGGAYVPLDPSYPADRLAFMLEDAQVPVLLTQQSCQERLPAHAAELILLDGEVSPFAQQPTTAPLCTMSAESLAYVIYTSGSTGRPKGTLVSHANVVRLFSATQDWYRFDERDVWTLFHSFAFDFSVWELWGALFHGGRLVVVPYLTSRTPSQLLELIVRAGVTVLNQTPSAFRQLMEAEVASGMAGGSLPLRLVIFGGEALEMGSLREWWMRHGDAKPQLVNMYGITETTVHVTYRPLSNADVNGGSVIGRAIPDLRVYALDKHQNLVPVGVAGELYVGGRGVARGYLNRRELTAQRYLPDPFSDEPGARMYRSGDLARWRADGGLEYLGRIDQQVKIRGHRIELGEIEAALAACDGVRASVVVVREERLVAYVVGTATAGTLRETLGQTLPQYMVPSLFVMLDALPLTSHGKIDRKALPAPGGERPELGQAYVAPRTAEEELLAAIWCQLLGLDRVGVDDNFFEVGGDSILSIQVVSRARRAGLSLTPRQVFDHPTVAAQAQVAGRAIVEAEAQGPAEGEVALTPIQHWFFDQELADAHHWNQAVMLRLHQPLDAPKLEAALQKVVAQHDALRMRFVRADGADGSWTQRYTALDGQPILATQALAQSELEGAAAAVQASLSLADGPLIRAVLFDLGDAGQRLLVVVHHLVVDGVSWRILLEDLQAAYRDLDLGARTTSMQRWSQRLAEKVQSGGLDAEIDYWLGCGAADPLPVDHETGAATEDTTQIVAVTLGSDETKALLQEAGRAYRTQGHELLVAALARTLCDWTGRDAISVRLEGHGREELVEALDVSRTVGWFTSMYPVRLDGGGELRDLVRGTKELLRGIPNKGVGYGLLRYLHPDAPLREQLAASQSEVVFNYLGQLDTMLGEDALFAIAREPSGPAHSPRAPREARLEVNAMVLAGQLTINFSFSDRQYRRETIERLAEGYGRVVRAILAHCTSEGAGGYTPSDFALAKLDQPTLDGWLGNRRDIEAIYPLSPMQEGMLFHTLLEPASGVYFEQMSCVLVGVDLDAFEKAWQQTVARHAVLRTSFWWEGLPRPLQCVHSHADVTIERLTAIDLEADRARGFALDQAPLMRLKAAPLDGARTQFVWSFHHLLLDGWSTSLVIRDLFEHYQANLEQRAPRLAPAGSHEAYVRWLAAQDRDAAAGFWRQTLRGFTTPTSLGARPTKGEVREERVELSATVSDALKQLARRHAVTLNNVVQAAWGLLLARYSGEQDVVFGVTVAGRPAELPLVESTVGLFINSVPMRLRFDAAASIGDCIKQAHSQQGALQAYEWTPLADIQGASEVGRGTPLFESLLVYENYPVDASLEASSNALGAEGVRTYEQTNYPLTVCIVPGTNLSIRMAHRQGAFDEGAIPRLAGQLRTLLEQMVGEPRVSELTLTTEAERRQLLVDWNDTAAGYPHQSCIHELFAAQAARTPDAIAVEFGDERLTYRQLDERSNQLAHHLQSLGVGPEVRVGVCVERSLEVLAGLLAILKAGGAYVPLDPGYPTDRLAFMVEDAALTVLVTQQRCLERLPAHAAQLVLLDDPTLLSHHPVHAPLAGTTAGSLVYVIYTSGSTGRPKGVCVPHGALVNLISWIVTEWPMADERMVLKTSLSFDAVGHELWAPLLGGGCVVVAPSGAERHPAELARIIERHRVTTLQVVPTLLAALVAEPAFARCTSLRRIYSGGEALEAELCQRVQATTRAQLINVYGPTEATVDAIWHDCTSGVTNPVPIGRPVANTRVYILDERREPVPVGIAGELYLGGAGVARGYLGRSELTAEKFIPSPFVAGDRLYRTGDLGRYRDDGVIEYLGRIDHQVKVRGYRIELGEIEAALLACDGVHAGVVVVRDERLVAYVVGTATAPSLREQLKATLPEYMVPPLFVTLESLPLTSNGKVDRKALPAPGGERPELGQAYLAPRTAAEELLAGIWCQLLGLDRVGIEDNFFEVGGDSILSIQVVSRARRAGLALTPRQVFDHPTVAAQAEVAGSAKIDVEPEGPAVGEVALTPIQHWFFAQELVEAHHWNQSVLLKLNAPLGAAQLEAALQTVVAQHDALRLRFVREAGGWTQRYAPVDGAPILTTQAVAPAEVESAAAAVQASLSLEHGPLLGAVLFDLGEAGQRLLLVVHHLVVDGVSWRILLEDLQAAARQVSLGARTTSMQRWSERLVEKVQSGGLDPELDYWLALGAAEALPVDHELGPATEDTTQIIAVTLPEAETHQLLHEAGRAYRTQGHELLVAALAQTLCDWSGRESVSVRLEGHGREELVDGVDLSRTVGWFTSMYPVRLDGGADLRDLVRATKETLRGIPNRGIGYGLLRYLHPDATLQRRLGACQSDVVFNYLGQFDTVLGEDALFAIARESTGPAHSPRGRREAQLEVSAMVLGGELTVSFSFSDRQYRRETIGRLADGYARAVRDIVAHCTSAGAGGYTPSDFALARLDQPTLDGWLGNRRDIEAVYPLSPMQEGMLFHTLLEPQSGVYFEQMSCVLVGLDLDAFEKAWQQTVARHAVLRTSLWWEGLPRPLQRVHGHVDFGIERLEAVDLEADRARGFALDRAPLVRIQAAPLDGERTQFV
ncbi:MAG: amino acid adenylation domain protein, partial [Myxococcales bacterium]|nr:amino acid adenylation domain protein [Myxococcales bacterium]